MRVDLYGINIEVPPYKVEEDVLGEKYNIRITEKEWLYNKILTATIYEVWDILEWLTNKKRMKEWVRYIKKNAQMPVLSCDMLNDLFAAECVGFRFVNGQITSIIDDIEIDAIEQAVAQEDVPAQHLKQALAFFADRGNPDYANSFKESITAVESLCCIILNDDNVTLGKALDKFRSNGIKLEPALAEAFKKIYGLASEKSGVRHGGVDAPMINQSLAQFMLVTCSAFVNYLRNLKSKEASTESP